MSGRSDFAAACRAFFWTTAADQRHRPTGSASIVVLVETLLFGIAIWGAVSVIPILMAQYDDQWDHRRSLGARPILGLHCSSNDSTVSVRQGCSNVINVDLDTGKETPVFQLQGRLISEAYASRDQSTWLLMLEQNETIIYRGGEIIAHHKDLSNDALIENCEIVKRKMNYCALSANGKTAVSVIGRRMLRRWDLSNKSSTAFDIEIPICSRIVALDPSGSQFVVSSVSAGLRIYDAVNGSLLRTLVENESDAVRIVFSENGQSMTVVRRRSIDLYDFESGKIVWSIPAEASSEFQTAEFSPDGKWIAAIFGRKGLQILDRQTRRSLFSFPTITVADKVAFPLASDKLYVGKCDGSLEVWSLSDWRLIKHLDLSDASDNVPL